MAVRVNDGAQKELKELNVDRNDVVTFTDRRSGGEQGLGRVVFVGKDLQGTYFATDLGFMIRIKKE